MFPSPTADPVAARIKTQRLAHMPWIEMVFWDMTKPLSGEKRNGIVQIMTKANKARVAERHTNPL